MLSTSVSGEGWTPCLHTEDKQTFPYASYIKTLMEGQGSSLGLYIIITKI